MFRTNHCCCSKGSGFIKRFLYVKLYSVFHSSWWNLFLLPSLVCRVTVAASLPPIFLSKYQSNTFLIFQQHLFPLSAIQSHRVSRGYLSLFQWSFFCIPHLEKKNGEKHYLYLSWALVQFPVSVWCCSSKPPAQLSLHPVPPLLLPLVGQGLLSPLIIPPLPHSCTSHIYLFIAT